MIYIYISICNLQGSVSRGGSRLELGENGGERGVVATPGARFAAENSTAGTNLTA